MRKFIATMFFVVLAAAPAAAQQPQQPQQRRMWQPEIGIKAGWVHADMTDADVGIDFIDIPGVGGVIASGVAIIAPAPLYGIIPIGDRMAIEPSFGFQNISAGASTTALTLGARFNYAFTPRVYFGVGPTMYLVKGNGLEDTQGAMQVALGYRRPLGTSFNFLAEGYYEVREKSEILIDATAYGVRIGAGAVLGGKAAAAPAAASARMWEPAIGIQGGWSLVSISGATDLTILSLPFAGQSVVGGNNILPGPSALFVLFPVGERLAIEPSIDIHNVKIEGIDPITSYEVGGRLNYAFNRKLYAGAGVEYTGIDVDGIDDGSSVAIVLATGLRFPVAGPVLGRTELSYRTFDGTDLYGGGQATSFSFGIMVPLK